MKDCKHFWQVVKYSKLFDSVVIMCAYCLIFKEKNVKLNFDQE